MFIVQQKFCKESGNEVYNQKQITSINSAAQEPTNCHDKQTSRLLIPGWNKTQKHNV